MMKKFFLPLLLLPAYSSAELVLLDEPTLLSPAAIRPSIQIRPAPDPKTESTSTKQFWDIRATDRNLREAFGRWAVTAGWQLSWEVEKDIQTAPANFKGSFEEALLEVVKAMQGTEKPISMCVYDNNVVRIVSSSLVCKRSQN